jgi:hypothetical protein
MNIDCKSVRQEFFLHQNPDLTTHEKTELKRHLMTCEKCQKEYEELLHTAALLESLPEPTTPPRLAERIQTEIRLSQRRQTILEFLANPIAQILVALRLGPHPTFVNYTAMLFYLMLTVFLIKLTFFNPQQEPSLIVRPLQPHVRIMTLGQMKKTALTSVRIDAEKPSEIPVQTQTNESP